MMRDLNDFELYRFYNLIFNKFSSNPFFLYSYFNLIFKNLDSHYLIQ